jgi:hypothetical protein
VTGYLADYDDRDQPITRQDSAYTFVDVRPTMGKDGKSMVVDLRYEDKDLQEIQKVTVDKGLVLQAPIHNDAQTKTTLVIPPGKTAFFRWSAPPTDKGERQYRMLLLSPSTWEPGK